IAIRIDTRSGTAIKGNGGIVQTNILRPSGPSVLASSFEAAERQPLGQPKFRWPFDVNVCHGVMELPIQLRIQAFGRRVQEILPAVAGKAELKFAAGVVAENDLVAVGLYLEIRNVIPRH